MMTKSNNNFYIAPKSLIEMGDGTFKKTSEIAKGDSVQTEWSIATVTSVEFKTDSGYLFQLEGAGDARTLLVDGVVTKLD